jgi:hypothetical protein
MQMANIILLLSLFFTCIKTFSQVNPSSDSVYAAAGIFEQVEIEASFPGGNEAWRKFLEKNLNPVVPVNNGAPSGRYTIIVQFIVQLDGSLSGIKALTNLGYGMEKEVVELIKKSGRWEPAMQNGRLVKAYRNQPVTFIVMDDSFEITTETPYTLFLDTDNEIYVSVKKIKPADVMLTISQGRITPVGDGRYIVKLNKPGRVIISIFYIKKNKQIGSASFEVKQKG